MGTYHFRDEFGEITFLGYGDNGARDIEYIKTTCLDFDFENKVWVDNYGSVVSDGYNELGEYRFDLGFHSYYALDDENLDPEHIEVMALYEQY